MSLALRHILTLVALVLINSGVGRALHTLAAHGPAHETSPASVEHEHVATPTHGDVNDCPQCDMLRAGSAHPSAPERADSASLDAEGWHTVSASGVSSPGLRAAPAPRGPPIA